MRGRRTLSARLVADTTSHPRAARPMSTFGTTTRAGPLPAPARLGLLLFIVALAARAAFLFGSPWARTPQTHDAVEYEALGWQLALRLPYATEAHSLMLVAPSGQPTAFRAPGLPLLIAGVYQAAGGRVPDAVAGVLVVLNALGAAALGLALARERGREVGALAGFAWALWPGALFTFYSSGHLLSENLAIAALLLALWCFGRPGLAAGAAAGLLLGIAILARTYLILMLPLLVAMAAARRRPLKTWAPRMAVFVACALVPPGLWTWRNHLVFGDGLFLTSQIGFGLWLGNHEGARGSWNGQWERLPAMADLQARHPELASRPEPEKSAIFVRAAIDVIRGRGPISQALLMGRKALLFLWPFESVHGFQWWLALALVPAGAGLLVAYRRDGGEVTAFLYAWLAAVVLSTVLFFHDVRLRYCGEPALAAFAAIGGRSLATRVRGGLPERDARLPRAR